jgi:hypothetical protein
LRPRLRANREFVHTVLPLHLTLTLGFGLALLQT